MDIYILDGDPYTRSTEPFEGENWTKVTLPMKNGIEFQKYLCDEHGKISYCKDTEKLFEEKELARKAEEKVKNALVLKEAKTVLTDEEYKIFKKHNTI